MKKILSNICGVIIAFGLSCSAFAMDITPTTSAVIVDGKTITFEAFNINGNNYFKLRDLAYVLNDSDSQFSIGYDATNDTVYLTSGLPYVVEGNELQKQSAEIIDVIPSTSAIIKDGKNIDISAFNINGNNYFKLRDVGEELDFTVDYDETTNSILVDTKKVKESPSNFDEDGFATNLFTPSLSPTPTPH